MSIRHVVLVFALAVAAASAGFLVSRSLRGSASSDVSAAASAAAPPADDELQIGDPRPDLRFTALDGSTVALSRFDGKPVLLNFWASWCPPCIEEMPLLEAFAQAHPEVHVVGVAVEPIDAARDFLAEHPVSYTTLIGSEQSPDESLQFGNRRGVLPYTVLIGADGRIRKRRSGAFHDGDLDAWVR